MLSPKGSREAAILPPQSLPQYDRLCRTGRKRVSVRAFGLLRRRRLFGGDLPLGEERLEPDLVAALHYDHVARRHRLPERALHVERLRHHHDVAAELAVI